MENDLVVEKKGHREAELNEFLDKDDKRSQNSALGDILFITSYPPRECGIASYSQNLVNAINNRFVKNFSLKICALESGDTRYYYPKEVTAVLNTYNPSDYSRLLNHINTTEDIRAVVVQHEFDLYRNSEQDLLQLIKQIEKPVIVIFHTVISNPTAELKQYIKEIASASESIIVLAGVSENTLINDYQLEEEKIEVIPYGTHLVTPGNAQTLKEKYKLTGKTVISTIGMLSPGKGIETTLEALPMVVKVHPEIMFLVIGKTHPEELKANGEKYRVMLESRVKSLKLQNHVQFLNVFFTPDIMKEYFQLSDICVFSSNNPNRPMSGMFAFAVSCGCPIISSPTPHAYEFLGDDAGFIYQEQNPDDLAARIIQLLDEPALRKTFGENILKKSLSSVWENSALLHQELINRITGTIQPDLNYPAINLDFLKSLTDKAGILHTSYKGEPDLRAGYSLDDNALALVVFCMHYKISGDINDIPYIRKYLKFLYHCYQPSGLFLKYVDYERHFTAQNYNENLEETQAKAIWALGYLFSMKGLLPNEMTDVAGVIMENAIPRVNSFISVKSIALAIKGLYYYYSVGESPKDLVQIKSLANRLVEMYRQNSRNNWTWFEDKFTSSAGILPGALLNSWLTTGDQLYKDVALETFEFLSSRTFNNNTFELKSKSDWKTSDPCILNVGEQPCDVAFNVITLSKFYLMCKDNEYFYRMDAAFKWFLGNNRLKQMVYNPVTGGCFEGLEENNVCLTQSADSALCYTLARMVVEKYKFKGENHINYIV